MKCAALIPALLVLLCIDSTAFAWGPLTHIQLTRDLTSQMMLVPGAVAALLTRHWWHYVYGTVAADVVFAKKLSRVKQICHHWTTGFSILDAAENEEDRAFAYGYLSHLAADTVAHNKYLPRQMALSRSTINFGHLYWEVRADSMTDPQMWERLRAVIERDYPGSESLLRRHLTTTMLPFGMNRRIFNQLNLLVSLGSWRRSVNLWSRVSRWPLPNEVLAAFHAESLERMIDVIRHGPRSTVTHDDPNGNAALGYARAQRRQLKQMKRARLSTDHAVAEAARIHRPRNGRSSD